jgi:hypothetical protein
MLSSRARPCSTKEETETPAQRLSLLVAARVYACVCVYKDKLIGFLVEGEIPGCPSYVLISVWLKQEAVTAFHVHIHVYMYYKYCKFSLCVQKQLQLLISRLLKRK